MSGLACYRFLSARVLVTLIAFAPGTACKKVGLPLEEAEQVLLRSITPARCLQPAIGAGASE